MKDFILCLASILLLCGCWENKSNSTTSEYILPKNLESQQIKPDKKDMSFGLYYPFEESKSLTASLDLSRYTHIVNFSYDVESRLEIHNKNTNFLLLNKPKSKQLNSNTEVFLGLTTQEANSEKTFLAKSVESTKLIRLVTEFLKINNTDGICLDFNPLPAFRKDQFSQFVSELTQSIKKINRDIKMCVVLPEQNFIKSFDFKILNTYVTYFVIKQDKLNINKKTSEHTALTYYLNAGVPNPKLSLSQTIR